MQTSKDSAQLLKIPAAISVQHLSELMDVSGIEVIKQLMRRGVMANITQVIDFDVAAIVAADFGFQPQEEVRTKARAGESQTDVHEPVIEEEDPTLLKPRAPVVTILGHVDHGKTTLLDSIRKTSVTASEKGGITQHIGAYQVESDGKKITFLDTPGHEAFTAMRARGAQVTDIAVLVVAADDGVMPQTREAVDHSKAANVPIIVAINKIDKEGANVDQVKQQLVELELMPEEWGGNVIMVPVSAATQDGISDLLENILLVAEISELKANPDGKAQGVVVEAKLDAARGPVATVLVKSGTLHKGNSFSVGETWGRVRAMFDENGRQIQEAGPSTPLKVLGIDRVPKAGDQLVVGEDGKRSRGRGAETSQLVAGDKLEYLLAQVIAGHARDLKIILKTDVEGSGEAIRDTLQQLENDQVRVKMIRISSGNVSENDVLLASASNAMILAFNTRSEPGAEKLAEREGVRISYYEVIYRLVEDMQAAVNGLLEPEYEETMEAEAVVKEVFDVKRGKVAGIGVNRGRLMSDAQVRIIRGGTVIHQGNIKSLRHFKDSVKEIQPGSEGGIGVEGFDAFEVGDTIESFRRQRK